MEAIKELLATAKAEQAVLWHKLTYRSETHAPTVADCMRWSDRIKELDVVIKFLKRHLDEKKT